MLRLVWAGLALACGVAQALAGSAVSAKGPGNAPMRFELRREGPAEVCGSNCRVWVSAVGYLTSDTPREFEAFAQKHDLRGAVLVLDSGRRLGAWDDRARPRHPPARDGHDRGQDHAAAAERAGRAPRQALAQCQLRIHVRLPAARRLAALRAAAGAGAGPPDLARQETQERARIRAIRPRSSTWSSAISGAWRNIRSRWAAASSCSRPRCGFRRGSRCMRSPPRRSSACGSPRSNRLFDQDAAGDVLDRRPRPRWRPSAIRAFAATERDRSRSAVRALRGQVVSGMMRYRLRPIRASAGSGTDRTAWRNRRASSPTRGRSRHIPSSDTG